MADTAIDIINASCHELGLPTTVLNAATGDTLGNQSLALLNALGEELTRVHDWQFLEKVMEFTGDGVTDRFPMPPDFKRQVNQTQWSKSDRRPLRGPDSPQIWSWSQYGIVSVGIFFRYRILGNEYAVFPIPGLGNEFAMYYISKNWVIDMDPPNDLKDRITKTGDIPMFDSRLLTAGLKVKLWAAKGFDTTVLQDEFNYLLAAEKAQNQGARVIDLCGQDAQIYLTWRNVPESGFGS
jgi:hypothetical protein